MKQLAHSFRFPLVLFVAVMLSGCGDAGPKRYPVRGRVTYEGKPVTTGNVTFVPEHGPMAGGTIGPDGSYTLQAVAGTHRVAVKAVPAPPPGMNPMQNPEGYVPPAPLVPAKYNRTATSGLTVEVKATDENVADLALP